jgi:hypothetical protein
VAQGFDLDEADPDCDADVGRKVQIDRAGPNCCAFGNGLGEIKTGGRSEESARRAARGKSSCPQSNE